MEITAASHASADVLQAVAEQLVATFGHAYPDWSTAEACRELANDAGLPMSLLAVHRGRAVGCVSLLENDEVDGFDGIGPWLGNLWVDPAHRGQGLGRELVDAVAEFARATGAASLHLVTDTAVGWHARNGWQPLVTASVHGHVMTVMRRSLQPPSGLR